MRIFSAFYPSHLPEAVRLKSPLAVQREIILQHLLNTVSGFALLGLLLYLVRTPINAANLGIIAAFCLAIIFQIILTLSRRWSYSLRAALLVLLLASESLAALSSLGLSGTALIYALALVAVTTVLFSSRAGLITLISILVIFSIVGFLMFNGRMSIPQIANQDLVALTSSWINILLAYLLTAAALIGAFHQLTSALSTTLEEQKALTGQWNQERAIQELHATQRTAELTRQTGQLEAARQISNIIARETDFERLLSAAATAFADQFRLSRAAIYRTNSDQALVELQASSVGASQNLPALTQRYRLDGSEPVSRSASSGQPVFTPHIENPLTPTAQTPHELLVPYHATGKVAGVILLHANTASDLTSLDMEVLTALADQFALTAEKSLQLSRLEQSLKSIEDSFRKTTQKSWGSHLKGVRHKYAYRYTQAKILPEAVQNETAARALQNGTTVVSSCPSIDHPEQTSTILAVPIKLRSQTLGVINLRVNASHISPELVGLVENAVNRLSISLENARLLEEIQNRADRERLVGEIATKVRSATDIESILHATASELGRSLGVAEVVVQLNKMK